MTELERFAAGVLAQWRAGGGDAAAPIGVDALLDRVFPYRVARRMLPLEASEDYEALVLRLIAEEEQLVRTEPLDAAEMARATLSSRLPDLDVLQLLRAASVTFSRRTMAAVEAAAAATPITVAAAVESTWAPPAAAPVAAEAVSFVADSAAADAADALDAVALDCWSCSESLPAGRQFKFCPFCGADQREPACAACGAALERQWKHCPECGTRVGG
jgi:RNA polymerase subunit RPABC4/transcription elongation factor Spt4